MPDACPGCGTPVERPAGEAMRYCPNVSCPGRVLEGIVHFASRDAMDIRGLGYERVRQLLEQQLIENVADLYELTAEQLVELERFAEQSAQQLVAAIAASKARPLSSLLFGLGIRHVGQDGRGAARPAVRDDGGADEGHAGADQRRAGRRRRHRRGGGRVLRRAAEPST